MLDVEFLRSLGIKENLLPPPSPELTAATLPRARMLNLPPELGRLEELALKQFLKGYCRQNGHYKFRSREGLVVAIYPYTAAHGGCHDVEMTISDFMSILGIAKVFKNLQFYRSFEEMTANDLWSKQY